MLSLSGAAYPSCWRRRREAAPIVAAGNLGTKKYPGGNSCVSQVRLGGRWIQMGMLQGRLGLTRKPGLSKACPAPGTGWCLSAKGTAAVTSLLPLTQQQLEPGGGHHFPDVPSPRPCCSRVPTATHPPVSAFAGVSLCLCPAAPQGVSLGPGRQQTAQPRSLWGLQTPRAGKATWHSRRWPNTRVGTVHCHCRAPRTCAGKPQATTFQCLKEETFPSELWPNSHAICWTNCVCTYLH